MTGGMSSRTCYTNLNFDFPYVRSLSLRRALDNVGLNITWLII